MPNWLDYTILILFPVIIAIESRRGFGLALFDLVALLAAIRFVPSMIPETAGVLRFSSVESVNHAYVYMVLCLAISGVFMIAATTVYNETVRDVSFVHPFFGGVLGIGTWMAASHILLRMLYISSGSQFYPAAISESVLASQCLDFQSLHAMANNLAAWALKSSP
jgi:hypothetical protein